MTNVGSSLPHLGMYLRILRQKNGLTITEVSQKADISRSHLSLIEKGKRHPGIEALFKICSVLGTHVHELFLLMHNELGEDDGCIS